MATSGRGSDAVDEEGDLPSIETVTLVWMTPSSQSAAQPLANRTESPRCTIVDPAALVTASTQPIGGRFPLEMEKLIDPFNGAVAPAESVDTAVTMWLPRLRPLLSSMSDQPVFANASLVKYAATSGREVEAVVVPTTLPSTETV